jgi:hypothetical protein
MALVLRPRPRDREIPLLITVAIPLLFFSVLGHKNIGVRYILFAYPLMAVWIARLPGAWRQCSERLMPVLRATVAVCCLWLALVVLLAWPDYLPFFNVPSGGPAAGHRHLLDSNLDWGQDLIALRDYTIDRHIESLDLAYAGWARPEYYGIRYRPFLGEARGSHVAISANLLWGRMYFMNGSGYWPTNAQIFARFRNVPPDAILGHTIYVFRSPQSTVHSPQSELGSGD